MLLLLIHNISFLTYQFNVHVCVNTRFLTDLFLGRRRTDLVEGIIHPSHGFRKSSPWNLRESCICQCKEKVEYTSKLFLVMLMCASFLFLDE